MYKGTLIGILLFLSFSLPTVVAEEAAPKDAFSPYRPIYFIAGIGDVVKTQLLDENSQLSDTVETQQVVKLSFSMKYQFFHEYKTGLYLAFTQDMFWDIFNESSPFSELNYNPDLFFRFESKNNFAQDLNTGILDYIQLGTEHKSNGLAGAESRGFDRLYAQLQLAVGEKNRISLNTKYFVFYQDFLPPWYEPEILDYADYRSNWEFAVQVDLDFKWAFFLPHMIRLEAGPGGGANQFDFSRGYQKLDVVFGDVFGGMAPYLQVWNGYSEGLIAYDETTLSIRAGVMLR